MESIKDFRKECMEKENGNGTVKKFHITLSDTSLTPAERGGSKKKDMQPAAPLEASEQQGHKLMEEIEKHHACQEHTSKTCYVMGSARAQQVWIDYYQDQYYGVIYITSNTINIASNTFDSDDPLLQPFLAIFFPHLPP
ncbi:hypothetical protein DFH07DRAFT_1068015 [Mycena maculata]|uniref:Uncharacterized protein n=1 Tax=Mycena maculata TaxID=230809 RepID=A0AAD7HE76_9AGAR|nr:hypothetical protein DFH07DRAFT_1068015 [Mycena maculata]